MELPSLRLGLPNLSPSHQSFCVDSLKNFQTNARSSNKPVQTTSVIFQAAARGPIIDSRLRARSMLQTGSTTQAKTFSSSSSSSRSRNLPVCVPTFQVNPSSHQPAPFWSQRTWPVLVDLPARLHQNLQCV